MRSQNNDIYISGYLFYTSTLKDFNSIKTIKINLSQ